MSYTEDYITVFQTASGISVITCSMFVTLKYAEMHKPLEKQPRLPCSTEMKAFLKPYPLFPILLKLTGNEEC